MNLKSYLIEKSINEDLSKIILWFEIIAQKISKALIFEWKENTWNTNIQWEIQIWLDIISNEIIINELNQNKNISILASEELDEIIKLNEKWRYAICFDPLDWSSLVDVNMAVWTIFWIYEWDTFIWKKVKEMICSWCIVYWPRTSMLISFWEEVCEFTLSENKEFCLTKSNIKIKNETKLFSPWNLRACVENIKYKQILDKWINEWKTLRYSWWMVPDMNAIFLKWEWIFTYPWYSKYPNWKLRLAYEVWPFSFLVKIAWWTAMTEKWEDINELEIKEIHQRSTIIIWSTNEVIETVKEI